MYQPAVGEVGLVAGGVFGLKASSVAFKATTAVPAAGGNGYAVNDTITLAGGTALRPVILTVVSLTGSAVASVTVTDAGLYSTAPTNPAAQASTSGSGTGATFTVTYTSADAISDLTGVALWTLLGASSYMATAMQQNNGAALALYIGAANLATAIQSSLPVLTPQCRLSLASLTPMINADVVGGTSIYVMPYKGNLIPIYSGSFFVCRAFAQTALTLAAQHSGNSVFDVFAYWDGATVQVGSGPAWATSTAGSGARGSGAGTTQLAILNGLYVNAVDITLRNGAALTTVTANKATYLGSFYTDATAGQVTCHLSWGQNRKWGLYNAHNRLATFLKAGDTTSSWTYSSAAFRPSNNAPSSWSSNAYNVGSGTACNGLTVLDGLQETTVNIEFAQQVQTGSAGAQIGIAVDGVTIPSGMRGVMPPNGSVTLSTFGNAKYLGVPLFGLSTYQAVEAAVSGNPAFAGGAEASMLLSASFSV